VHRTFRWIPADLAQAFQYVWRCGQKDDPIQELNKAIWFIEDELSINEEDKHIVNYIKIETNLPDVLSYEIGHKRDALANIARANELHAPRWTKLCKAVQSIKEMIKEYELANDKS